MPPEHLELLTAEDTRHWGQRLGALLRAGDLVVLTGGLGAGKTTLTQGIGSGLGVRPPVTSPTFVIARLHPSLVGGPELVHADAYRLGGVDELDDLDLDTSLEEAVTVIEWGQGLAEGLAEHRLEITLTQGTDVAVTGGGPRQVRLTAYGSRWTGPEGAAQLDSLRPHAD